MKKTNIFKIILGLIPACFLSGISAVYNINNKTQNINTARKPTDEEIKDLQTKKIIDATLIGAVKGTFTVKCIGKYCVLVKVSNNFLATGNFNFNGGKFTYQGAEYIITEIESEAFNPGKTGWFFKNCNLTIPSTITKIGDYAFCNNSRNWPFSDVEITSINFEEGIEYIGKKSFFLCKDLESSTLVLPNSLQYIGNEAFGGIEHLHKLDLTALDHVISLDVNPLDWYHGCLSETCVKTFLVKDQAMKDKYFNDQYWPDSSEWYVCKGE